LTVGLALSPAGTKENRLAPILSPLRGSVHFGLNNPRLKPRAIAGRARGACLCITHHAISHAAGI
jgi:hypothetical protein